MRRKNERGEEEAERAQGQPYNPNATCGPVKRLSTANRGRGGVKKKGPRISILLGIKAPHACKGGKGDI